MIHPYGVVATLLLWTAQGTPLDGTWLLTRIFRGGSPATTRAVPLHSTVYIQMSLESHTGGWFTGSLYRRYFVLPKRTKLAEGYTLAPDAPNLCGSLKRVVLDELHA